MLVPLQSFRQDDVKLDGGTELGCVELLGCDVDMSSQGVGPCGCVVESDGSVAPVSGFKVEQGGCFAQSGSEEGRLPSQVWLLVTLPMGVIYWINLLCLERVLVSVRVKSWRNCCVRLGMCLPWMTELGFTSLVQHMVDTEDHPAIKQLP